jgi:hypothetical protein
MREVHPKLFVGDEADYEACRNEAGWSFLTCAKEPWHRSALGYTGRGAPRDHPEYLFARRGDQLILNMVDAMNAAYFHPEMMDAGVQFIEEELEKGRNVLIHCNQGHSRAPGMAFYYLWKKKGFGHGKVFSDGELEFKQHYPSYNPSEGIREFIRVEWRRP